MNKIRMSNKINTEELKTMIVGKIKEIGLNDVLDTAAVERIKDKVMGVYNHEKAKASIADVIPENTIPAGMGVTEMGNFPKEETPVTGDTASIESTSIEAPVSNYDGTIQPGQNVDAGTTGNIPAYAPELPSFMDKIEPAKVIVFSQNELSESGENLTKKPLRTYEDPDIKKTMNDLWLDKGQKRAEVYVVKLEKIGELEFNYTNGTTQFVEKRFDPDFDAQNKYKENPYMADNAGPALPGDLDINGQPNIAAQIATSVDIEQIVKDLVMKMLKDQLMTNTTKAINADEFNSDTMLPKHQNGVPMYPMGALNPNSISESFEIKMIDLVNDYNKIDTPKTLKEAIEKNDKTFLVKENTEVQEWKLEGKTYYTPVVKMSTKKCYIK